MPLKWLNALASTREACGIRLPSMIQCRQNKAAPVGSTDAMPRLPFDIENFQAVNVCSSEAREAGPPDDDSV